MLLTKLMRKSFPGADAAHAHELPFRIQFWNLKFESEIVCNAESSKEFDSDPCVLVAIEMYTALNFEDEEKQNMAKLSARNIFSAKISSVGEIWLLRNDPLKKKG